MAPQETRRTNEEWLDALRAEGTRAGEAQKDLRLLVAGALRKATAAKGPLDEGTLDDLTQVAVLHVLQKLDRFEGKSRFTTWAYSVAVRAAFTELRKPQYRTSSTPAEALADVAAESEGEPTRQAERQEIVDLLHEVIEKDLSERQRTAILGELRGTPQEELLAQLETNRNALHKLLHDARNKLRQGLAAAGICDHQVREAFDL